MTAHLLRPKSSPCEWLHLFTPSSFSVVSNGKSVNSIGFVSIRKAQQLEKAAAAQQERRNAQMRQVAREKAMAKAAEEQARRQEEVAKSNTGLSRPAYHRRR